MCVYVSGYACVCVHVYTSEKKIVKIALDLSTLIIRHAKKKTCMCLYIHLYMYVCLYIYIYIYGCMYMSMHVCVGVFRCIFVCVYVKNSRENSYLLVYLTIRNVYTVASKTKGQNSKT